MKIIKNGEYTPPTWNMEYKCTKCGAILLIEDKDLVYYCSDFGRCSLKTMCPICTRKLSIIDQYDNAPKLALRAYYLCENRRLFKKDQDNPREAMV